MNNILFNFFFSLSVYPMISWFFIFVSNVLIYVFILIAIIYPLIKNRDYIYSLIIGGTGVGAWIISYFIKNIFKMPRPFIVNHIVPLVMESGYSFPSSHVTVFSALTVVIWKINYKIGIVFAIFTVLVALSRMIIGVHYPIDVIFGMCFGVGTGLFVLWFYKITKQFAFLRKYL